jgi:ribonuclease HI
MRRFCCARAPRRPLRCFSTHSATPLSVLAYADGASRGNPGRSGCGALLVEPGSGRVLASDTQYVGDRETNNTAEYHGLMLALRLAQRLQATHVHVHMDSQLIVRQMQGQYRVKAANLQALHQQCQELTAALPHVTFSHVLRGDNSAADCLANQAIDEYDAKRLTSHHPDA